MRQATTRVGGRWSTPKVASGIRRSWQFRWSVRWRKRATCSTRIGCLMLRWMPVYPAVEMFGEGIFLRFDENRLSEWEALPEVRARADILVQRRNASPWAQRLDPPEPRFIALHTIAHLLIRRLAFASGYSSASL
jgi:hypothetical protein